MSVFVVAGPPGGLWVPDEDGHAVALEMLRISGKLVAAVHAVDCAMVRTDFGETCSCDPFWVGRGFLSGDDVYTSY